MLLDDALTCAVDYKQFMSQQKEKSLIKTEARHARISIGGILTNRYRKRLRISLKGCRACGTAGVSAT